MGVAALVLAITAIIFGLIPLIYTQLVGIVIGSVAVILGLWGRKQAKEQGRSAGLALASMVLGVLAVLISSTLYATFIHSGKRAGEEVVRRVGTELERGKAQGTAFRASMERAIERAYQEQTKQGSGSGARGGRGPQDEPTTRTPGTGGGKAALRAPRPARRGAGTGKQRPGQRDQNRPR